MGAMNYGFNSRRGYLDTVMALEDYEEIRAWFLEKMMQTCYSIRDKNEDRSESLVEKRAAICRKITAGTFRWTTFRRK